MDLNIVNSKWDSLSVFLRKDTAGGDVDLDSMLEYTGVDK